MPAAGLGAVWQVLAAWTLVGIRQALTPGSRGNETRKKVWFGKVSQRAPHSNWRSPRPVVLLPGRGTGGVQWVGAQGKQDQETSYRLGQSLWFGVVSV